MSLKAELKTAYNMAFKKIQGHDHAQRLENFYANQASFYDEFRKRLLKGREELYQSTPVIDGGVWVEMGGGTAFNLEFIGPQIKRLKKVYVVDLSTSLLEIAHQRIKQNGWDNVELVRCDVIDFNLPEKVDTVMFSYSLTMIPQWFLAIDRALELLKPQGQIGVVDFYVSTKYVSDPQATQSWWTRHFWPIWFGFDNVHLHPHILEYLKSKLQLEWIQEQTTSMPFVPFLGKVPYFQLRGKKK